MNRRGFLQAAFGLAASRALPALPVIAALPAYGWVNWRVYTKAVVLNEQWLGRIESVRWIEAKS